MNPWLAGIGIALVLLAGFVVLFPAPAVNSTQNPDIETVSDSDLVEGVVVEPPREFASLSECETISTTERPTCVQEVAIQSADPAICEGLDADSVDWCKGKVLVSKDAFESCDTLSANAANQCYFDAARKTNRESYCQSISLVFVRDDCYRGVAEANQDLRICDSISDADIKDDCFLRVVLSLENPNPSDCTRMVASDMRDDCYYGTALILHDASICQSIQDEYWKSNCQTDVLNPDAFSYGE